MEASMLIAWEKQKLHFHYDLIETVTYIATKAKKSQHV